jgi:arylsulfatase A-like enzyme/Flp pilus assembly protein TadD
MVRLRRSIAPLAPFAPVLFFAAAVLALSSWGCREKISSHPRNLLLITIDTVRADHVGAYGYRAAETPALDRLAREGILFDRAESSVPLTLPSHATILSGLTPPHHGLRNNGAGSFPDGRATLATALSKAGFSTGAFVGSFVLDHRFGLARGFDVYDDEIERDPNAPGSLEAERSGSQVADRALAWLEKVAGDRERPFFAWVHFYDAHAPYTPPEPYASRHKDTPYDGEIAFVDAQVARLLELLDRRGLTDSTLIAVAADHGEALGEHDELTHGLLLYEPTLRVPLLLRGPGAPAGKRIRTPIGLVDLAPTLAGMLGKPLVEQEARNGKDVPRLDGHDLSAAIVKGVEPGETDLYAETEYPRTFGWSGHSALRRGRLKYIAAPRAELYDLSRDPGEVSNLLAEGVRRADLDGRLVKLEEGAVAAAPAVGRDEIAANLRSLGYISGAGDSASSTGGALKDPKEMVPLFRKFEEANWSLQSGKLSEAAHRLEPLVAADPKNSVFRGFLAEAYRRQKDYPRAIALYRRAVADAPADPDARYNLAVTLQEAGRAVEAREALEEAIRRDASRPEAHNALGIALSAGGKLQEALAEFDRAGVLDPRDARAQNNRGNILRQLGRLPEAEQAYRRSIELAPRYAEPLNGLGVLEVARDRPAAALPYFERALELAPQYHEVLLNMGIALETFGKTSAALASYREFVRAAAGDPSFAAQRNVARQLIARLSSRRPLESPGNQER